MIRRALALATVLLLLSAAAAAPVAAQAPTIRWSMANEYPATSIQGETDARFAREVSERSGGRIQIAHQYDAASGFRSKDMVEAIGRGAVAVGNTYMGALGALDPVFLLPSLPFLATTAEQAQALAEVARVAYEQVLTRHDQRLLFLSPWPPAGLWARAPVTSLEALKGLRIRTADANGVLAFRAAGAVPVQISFSDAIPKLKAGELDAVLSSGDGGAGARLAEVLKHFTAIEYAVTMSMVTINAEAWRALDPELQKAVLAAAAATEARQWEVMKTRVAANYAQMRAAGVGITTEVSPEYRRALREAGQVAVDDWLQKTGPAGVRILDDYRKRLGR
ncbi:MAG TPA: TRAP transporter substrate-binding protein [Patescibacteria group bacterium]|nr:TRAP transporter substrate-binding protein [Patescibacteria group bacterium]